MTTRLRAKFDGSVFVPMEPVDLPIGEELELEIRDTSALTNGSPELLRHLMQQPPRIPAQDVDELERSIDEGKRTPQFRGEFDDEK